MKKKTFFLFLFVYLLTNDISFSFYSDKLQILWNVLFLAHKNNDKSYLESNVWKIGEGEEEEGYIHIFFTSVDEVDTIAGKKNWRNTLSSVGSISPMFHKRLLHKMIVAQLYTMQRVQHKNWAQFLIVCSGHNFVGETECRKRMTTGTFALCTLMLVKLTPSCVALL